ncbi:MAG: branched-chain amino acid ABC transporter permease [Mycobacteriales bacterium]
MRRPVVPDLIGPISDRWARTPVPARYVLYALLIVGAVLLPANSIGSFMSPQSDWSAILFYPIGVYILLAIGLNVVVGQAGLLDLGYVAFFAIGGYTMAKIGIALKWDFWAILPVGILVAAVAGVILGAPTLRLRGDYLAIVTLGFGEIVRITANNLSFTGGPRGLSPIPNPPSVGSWSAAQFNVTTTKPFYYLVLILIVVAIVLVKRLERSRVGRAWAAIREDEDAAEVMGVPTFRYKLWAFAIGACIGGAAGVMFASQTISITPDNFPFLLSSYIVVAVVLGGSGNLPGVILGAFLVAWLPERFRGFADYRVLVFGGALVLMMILRPEGLLPSRQRRAELDDGSGGMGSLGGEVGAVAAQSVSAGVPARPDDVSPDRPRDAGPGMPA